MRKQNKGIGLRAAVFLTPSMVGFAFFSVIPIILSFLISLTDWTGLQRINLFSPSSWTNLSLQNYADILRSQEFWTSLQHVGYFIVLYIPLLLVTSMSIALLLNRPVKGSMLFRVVYYIPVLTSWIAGALIWKWVLSPEFGAVNDLLAKVGIEGPGWLQDEKWAMPSIVLASAWKDMGFYGLILLGGLKAINPEYYEAADVDGASKLKKFFKITLPMLSPTLYFVLIISIINAFMLFPQVMVMAKDAGPNGATQVIVERIYKYGFRYFKMGYASALSWLLFIIIFGLTYLQKKMQKKWVNYDA